MSEWIGKHRVLVNDSAIFHWPSSSWEIFGKLMTTGWIVRILRLEAEVDPVGHEWGKWGRIVRYIVRTQVGMKVYFVLVQGCARVVGMLRHVVLGGPMLRMNSTDINSENMNACFTTFTSFLLIINCWF